MKLINVNLSKSRFFLETILVGREMPYNLSNYGYFATRSISGVLLDLSTSFIILRPFQIVSTFFATELPNLTSISNSSRQRRSQRACSKAAAETWVQGSWWFAHNPEISKGKRRQTFKITFKKTVSLCKILLNIPSISQYCEHESQQEEHIQSTVLCLGLLKLHLQSSPKCRGLKPNTTKLNIAWSWKLFFLSDAQVCIIHVHI